MISPEYIFDACVLLMKAGKRTEAAKGCWEVIRRNPHHADAWAMRAMIEAMEGRHENAMIHHGFALRAAPQRHDLWANSAIDAVAAQMWDEAENGFKKSIELQDSFEGRLNYGNLLCQLMRLEEALTQYEAAFSFDKYENAQLRVNYGEVCMALGDWKRGFKNYRWRGQSPGFPPPARLNYRKWQGESPQGKTFLLYAEQGFGDEIQSLRFARLIEDAGGTVLLAVRPPMLRAARSFTPCPIMLYDLPPFEPDYQCALLDVPGFIECSPDTVPGKRAYLSVDERGFRLAMPVGLNVGVCWASGKRTLQPHTAAMAEAKSLSFEQLVKPLAREGVNLFSLQQHHDDHRAMADLGMRDPMAGVTDFADTAFIIDHLDLVISVDTSVAHLAGAMGKPVWNFVRHDAIWPWFREGLNGSTSTCWYDSMTIYRQEKPFDWTAPLKRMTENFGALVDKGRCDERAA